MQDTGQHPQQHGKARILVVDDNQPVRDMLVRWLRSAGHQCDSAANTTEAVAAFTANSFDLVITDHCMPGCTGLDFLSQIQNDRADVAVIMLTACEDPRFATQAMTRGAWGYLLKPVELKDLLFQVSRALERRRVVRETHDRMVGLEQQLQEQTRRVRLAHEELIHRLVVASMVRDDETGAHIKRIGLFSARVAEAAGWPADVVEHMRLAAPMHDIGKIGIPDAILLKPGKLTPEEFEIMKTHTIIGANILKNSDSPMMQLAEQIARSHHEWWNGTGYPDGLRGEAISPAARIVAIVDVYDALTHDRVYRPALPESEALSMLEQGRGVHFDSEMLDVFLGALPAIRETAAKVAESELTDAAESAVKTIIGFRPAPLVEVASSVAVHDPATVGSEVTALRQLHSGMPTTSIMAMSAPRPSGPLSRFLPSLRACGTVNELQRG